MDSHKEMQFGHRSPQANRSTGKRSRQETGSRKNLKKKLENGSTSGDGMDHRQSPPRPSLPPPPPPPLLPRSSLSSSADVQERDKEEDQSSPQKQTRLIWTLELHKKFVDAVEFLGECDAVPSKILRVMGVDGITRENVASHLQKYRYKKQMQANSHGDSSNPGPGERTPIPPTSEEMLHELRWAAIDGSVSQERRYSGSFQSFFACFRRFAFSKNEESEKPKEGTEDLSNCVQGGTTSFVELLKDIQGDRSFVQLLNDIQGGGSFVQSPLPPPPPPPPPPGFGPRPCSGAPPLPNVVEYMKQEIEIMKSKLEKEGNRLSPETRENLEKEIRSFTEKYSSIFGSSTFK